MYSEVPVYGFETGTPWRRTSNRPTEANWELIPIQLLVLISVKTYVFNIIRLIEKWRCLQGQGGLLTLQMLRTRGMDTLTDWLTEGIYEVHLWDGLKLSHLEADGAGYINTQTQRSHKPTFSFQNKERSLKRFCYALMLRSKLSICRNLRHWIWKRQLYASPFLHFDVFSFHKLAQTSCYYQHLCKQDDWKGIWGHTEGGGLRNISTGSIHRTSFSGISKTAPVSGCLFMIQDIIV
jgi:hypothetical protein